MTEPTETALRRVLVMYEPFREFPEVAVMIELLNDALANPPSAQSVALDAVYRATMETTTDWHD